MEWRCQPFTHPTDQPSNQRPNQPSIQPAAQPPKGRTALAVKAVWISGSKGLGGSLQARGCCSTASNRVTDDLIRQDLDRPSKLDAARVSRQWFTSPAEMRPRTRGQAFCAKEALSLSRQLLRQSLVPVSPRLPSAGPGQRLSAPTITPKAPRFQGYQRCRQSGELGARMNPLVRDLRTQPRISYQRLTAGPPSPFEG